MAEVETISFGGSASAATFSASSLVPFALLSMMRRFFWAVQRSAGPEKMLSPARWTTASVPSRSPSMVPDSGAHRTSPAVFGDRVRRVTVWPFASSSGVSADPMRPVAPLIRTFISLLCWTPPQSPHGSVQPRPAVCQLQPAERRTPLGATLAPVLLAEVPQNEKQRHGRGAHDEHHIGVGAHPRGDLLPVRPEDHAGPDQNRVPDGRPQGRQDDEPQKGHLHGAGGDGDDAPRNRDYPGKEHHPIAVAPEPALGLLEVRLVDPQPLPVAQDEPASPPPPERVQHHRTGDAAEGGGE